MDAVAKVLLALLMAASIMGALLAPAPRRGRAQRAAYPLLALAASVYAAAILTAVTVSTATGALLLVPAVELGAAGVWLLRGGEGPSGGGGGEPPGPPEPDPDPFDWDAFERAFRDYAARRRPRRPRAPA